MKFATLQAVLGSALLLTPAGAEMHGHRLAHSLYAKRHSHSHGHAREAEAQAVEKRSTCALPNDPDIVQIGGQLNGGWALPPDRPCAAGMYCPYACVPGKVMNQWKPNTTYVYPESQVSFFSVVGSSPWENGQGTWLTGPFGLRRKRMEVCFVTRRERPRSLSPANRTASKVPAPSAP